MKKFLIGIMIAVLPTSIFAIGGFGLSVNSSTFAVDAGSSDIMVENIKVGSFSYDSFENGGGIGGYLYLDIIPVVDLDIEYNFNFSEEEKYNHLLYIIPKLLISISTLFGILYLIADKKNILNFLSLYYLSNVALFSIFFILPRYSLITLPIQVILSCYFIKKLNIKIFNKILC